MNYLEHNRNYVYKSISWYRFIVEKILSCQIDITTSKLERNIQDLILNLVCLDPTKRICGDKILEHPYFHRSYNHDPHL